MNTIVIIDTCILLNILDVPGHNQDKESIEIEFQQHVQQGDRLLLPMATILETGSHIAKIPELVIQTHRGEAPWSPIAFPDLDSIILWLDQFPDFAMQGVGFADVTIIKDWEKVCDRHPMSRVKIWSIDGDLGGYDCQP